MHRVVRWLFALANGTILNALRVALRIISGIAILDFAFGATAFAEHSAAIKAPVGLLSGRAVCVSRWREFTPTSSAERSKRIFTGGVVMENGNYSATSCGSAALRAFPAITSQNKKAIAFAFLHQRWLRIGAADEARTRYLHLGKVALYQMSYGRISGTFIPAPSRAILANFGAPAKACGARFCGEKEKIWYSSQKSCLQDFPMNDRIFDVVPPIGIEPMTRGFSVPCSTD